MNFIRITVNIILLLLIAACSGTIPVCPPNFETGNPGGTINSHYDEFSPIIDDSTLVFYSARQHKGIYFSHILNNTFQNALCDTFFSMNKFPNTAFPAFCVNPATKAKEVFFAATVSENKKKNTQLLFSEFTRGAWSKPKFLRHEINTPFIESYPSVSPDGKLLVFASDRPDGFGGLDIYSATRRSDGSWGM